MVTNVSTSDSATAAQSQGGPSGIPAGGGSKSKPLMSGAAGSTTQAVSVPKIYDPRDTNKDGVVSLDEEYQYDLLHPEAVKTKPSAGGTVTSYDSHGNDSGQKTLSRFDVLT